MPEAVGEKPVERLPYDEAEIAAAVRRLRNYGIVVATGGGLWVDGQLLQRWLRENVGRPAPTAAGPARRP